MSKVDHLQLQTAFNFEGETLWNWLLAALQLANSSASSTRSFFCDLSAEITTGQEKWVEP